MIELYKAEFRRFARWALGLGVLHAAALFLLDRSFPWMRDDGEMAVVAAFAFAAAGAIFGFYQSAAYARMNQWIALLHRPLAPWRIMAAVSGASATLLSAAVAIPLLLFTAALTLQAGRVVDARHWLLAPAGALFALIGFGIGSYLALAPRRYGWTALVPAFVLIVSSLGTGPAALLLPLVIVAVLALLMAGAFKPDRSLPPSKPGLVAPTAGVAALSLYFLLIGGSGLAWQLGLAAVGRNPEMNAPPPGGVVEASRAASNDLIAAGLAAAPGPEAAAARMKLRGVAAMRLPVGLEKMPARGELTNAGPIAFTESRTGIQWTYSHDRNGFLGLRLMDRRAVGELRPAGGFEAPPLLSGDGSMIAGGSLYRLDPRSGTLGRRLRLSAGEAIVAKPVLAGPVVAVLGDRALYLADRSLLEGGRVSTAKIAVPLPGMIGDLQRLDMAHLGDRTILSFLFGRDSIEGPTSAWQTLVSVAPDGTVRTLAQRSLHPDYSEVLRFRSYWLSPALRALAGAGGEIGSGSAWTLRRAPVEVPAGIWIAAALLSLGAAAATALLAVRRRLAARESAAWTLAALAFGLPMFGAFWLIRKGTRLTLWGTTVLVHIVQTIEPEALMPATSLLACLSALALAGQASPPQTAAAPSGAPPAGERQPVRSGAFFPPDEAVRAFVRPYIEKRQARGIVIGLVEPDGSRRVLTFGEAGEGARPLAARSVFEIGSITKTFTGTVLADMVRRGEVRLDDPVANYLPAGVRVPSLGGRRITLLDLATHRSGLPRLPTGYVSPDPGNPYGRYAAKDLYAFLGSHALEREPGAKFEYSNLGMGLLGHALARAAGAKNFQALVARRVLRPLGMKMTAYGRTAALAPWMTRGHDQKGEVATHFDMSDAAVLAGGGGLNSTVDDLMTYLDANIGEPTSPLEHAMRDARRGRHLPRPGMQVGLGWMTMTRGPLTLVGHNGGTAGYSAYVAFDPGTRAGVVVLANSGGFEYADKIGRELLDPGRRPLIAADAPKD
jgi:CubicO group peptidase (beta-lactamase class C family)